MSIPNIGVDISKLTFDQALLKAGKVFTAKFPNNAAGFDQFAAWLKDEHAVTEAHVCMEATGKYGEALATYLVEHGFKVSMVNPAQIKGFAKSQLTRTKTDKHDAGLIARFCQAFAPPEWKPTPKAIRHLRGLVQTLDALQEMRLEEANRLQSVDAEIAALVQHHLDYLDQQIKALKRMIREHMDSDPELYVQSRLLASIPGVGEATIAQVLALLGDIRRFKGAKQVAAYIGLNTRQHESGTSIHGRARLSKVGSARLRKALYMPAIVAKQCNPAIRALCERLIAKGRPAKLAIDAAMRKLAHIIYGVLKSGRPFDAKTAMGA